MGTNFYARIIPTKKRKDELKQMIDNNDFKNIIEEISKTYGKYEYPYSDEIAGEIHLGKRSGGWKFLWNPNIYLVRNGHCEWIENKGGGKSSKWIDEPDTAKYIYPLTKKGIKSFIDRDDVEIYDEYGEKQDKEEFFEMALDWVTWNNREAWDSKTYAEYEKSKNPNYREFKCHGEYIDLLKSEGFEMISDANHDFYSDGLRFSTSTDFS